MTRYVLDIDDSQWKADHLPRVLRTAESEWLNELACQVEIQITDVRPLIVLDLSDYTPGILAHLIDSIDRAGYVSVAERIREQTKPVEWSTTQHSAEQCKFEQCAYCGCCAHGKTLIAGCKVEDAPSGMCCPTWGCGCEGKS